MIDLVKAAKQFVCSHDYKRAMKNTYPDGHEEHVYICMKCGKEVRIRINNG